MELGGEKYIELIGTPGASLNGMSILIIGDCDSFPPTQSGCIEEAYMDLVNQILVDPDIVYLIRVGAALCPRSGCRGRDGLSATRRGHHGRAGAPSWSPGGALRDGMPLTHGRLTI